MVSTNTLEQERYALKRKIELSDALDRLKNNADFVTVFEMHYFKEYVSKLVLELGKHTEHDSEIIQTLKQIGGLQQHLNTINQEGAMAKESLKEMDAIPLSEYDYD